MLVLLDRDGVINRDAKPGILHLSEFKFLPRAKEAIAMLTRAKFQIAICTNQSAISRGTMSIATLDEIHAHLIEEVKKAHGHIDRIYYAPDSPDHPSTHRKPAPGMLLDALRDFNAEATHTPMVGDMLRDMEAAATAGCPRILVRSGKGAITEAAGIPTHVAPVKIVDDLYEAAEHICEAYR